MSEYRLKIGVFSLQQGKFGPKFQVEGVAPAKHSSCQKTRMNDLSCGIRMGTSLYRFVTMHALDRRTERPWQYRALHYMWSRGKNDGEQFLLGNIGRLCRSA